MTDCRKQLTFDFHPRKDVVADFHGGLITSDAGLLPVRQLDQRLGWTAAVADVLDDTRQAGRWEPPRRILYKVEVNGQGTNRRFVVTNGQGTPWELWPVYDDRGTAETFIDEFKNGLPMDRLSCRRFTANAFRLVLTAVAYSLMRAYRGMLAGAELETASAETIRSRLIKIGARVRRTVRRVWVHIAEGFPLREALERVCLAILRLHPPPLIG